MTDLRHEEKEQDDIWEGDLFGRKAEAEKLIGYLESVYANSIRREDSCGYTIAVEGGYGVGKTYFLKRFAKEVARKKYPVAYIDAWADDFSDEPLLALLVTLKASLPSKKIGRVDFSALLKSAGEIAAATAASAIPAATGLAAENLWSGVGGVVAAGSGGLSRAVGSRRKVPALFGYGQRSDDFERRFRKFQDAQKAIGNLKQNLSELIRELPKEGVNPPIFIVVDELDRCRPTYAVKLLEEIKHLFDVEGLIFVVGMNREQLGKSVSGVYGSNFDGGDYLKRFFNRYYRLGEPDKTAFIQNFINNIYRFGACWNHPAIFNVDNHILELNPAEVIALYCDMYNLSLRDIVHLVDILEVCVSFADGKKYQMAFLLPLIAATISRGQSANPKPEKIREDVRILDNWAPELDDTPNFIQTVIENFNDISTLSYKEAIERATNLGVVSVYAESLNLAQIRRRDSAVFVSPLEYRKIINEVARFSSPETLGEEMIATGADENSD